MERWTSGFHELTLIYENDLTIYFSENYVIRETVFLQLLRDTFAKLDPTTLQDVDPSDTRRNMKAHADPPLRLGQQLVFSYLQTTR